MRFTNMVKGAAVALPLMMLAACSTNNDAEAESQASTTNQTTTTDNSSAVELTPAQKLAQAKERERQRVLDTIQRKHTIYFDFDKSRVDSSFSSVLDDHATYLRANDSVKVLIEGHADERGTPEYNIALGERRALAVSRYLVSSGVSESQISIVSYGEEKPALKSRTEAAFAKNRRAVLVY